MEKDNTDKTILPAEHYTRRGHIFDECGFLFSRNEHLVINVIIRNSTGYNKEWCDGSINGVFSKNTKLSRSSICRAITSLYKRGFVLADSNGEVGGRLKRKVSDDVYRIEPQYVIDHIKNESTSTLAKCLGEYADAVKPYFDISKNHPLSKMINTGKVYTFVYRGVTPDMGGVSPLTLGGGVTPDTGGVSALTLPPPYPKSDSTH